MKWLLILYILHNNEVTTLDYDYFISRDICLYIGEQYKEWSEVTPYRTIKHIECMEIRQ